MISKQFVLYVFLASISTSVMRAELDIAPWTDWDPCKIAAPQQVKFTLDYYKPPFCVTYVPPQEESVEDSPLYSCAFEENCEIISRTSCSVCRVKNVYDEIVNGFARCRVDYLRTTPN
jgi:hypothetical protein